MLVLQPQQGPLTLRTVDGRLVGKIGSRDEAFVHVSFSADGALMLCGSKRGTLRIVDQAARVTSSANAPGLQPQAAVFARVDRADAGVADHAGKAR